MTLRITSGPAEAGRIVLRLEGRFTGSDLPILDSCVAGRAPEDIALDLSELHWIDPAAAGRLDSLVASGAGLIATSAFVECLLARPAPDAPTGSNVPGRTHTKPPRR